MKPLYATWTLFLAIGSTAVGQNLAQAPSGPSQTLCQAQPVEHPLVKGRASTVTFPDGRSLMVVGHNHGNRQIYALADMTFEKKWAHMSDQEFEKYMLQILEENRKPLVGMEINSERKKIIYIFNKEYGVDITNLVNPNGGLDLENVTPMNHAKQDYIFLTNLRGMDFVGYEGSQETWKNNFPIYLFTINAVMEEFYKRKDRLNLTEKQMREVLLSASNGHIFAYIETPELQKYLPMVGTEDKEAGKKYQDSAALERMEEALQNLKKVDSDYWKTRQKEELDRFKKDPIHVIWAAKLIYTYNQVSSMNITSLESLKALTNNLEDTAPVWMKTSLSKLIEIFKERIQLNLDRDHASAENLADRHQTGVHFVGLNHMRNTLRNLEDLCRSEMTTSKTPRPVSAVR